MRYAGLLSIGMLPLFILVGCGRPSGMAGEDYAEYQRYGAPKFIFTCTTPAEIPTAEWFACESNEGCQEKLRKKWEKQNEVRIGYSVGIGMGATFNQMVQEAKDKCAGEFKILQRQEFSQEAEK